MTRSATKDVSLKNNNLHLQPLIKSLAYHEEVPPANQLFHLAYKRASVLRITTSLVSHRPLGKQVEDGPAAAAAAAAPGADDGGEGDSQGRRGGSPAHIRAAFIRGAFHHKSSHWPCLVFKENNPNFVVGFQFKAPIVLARIRICIRMYVGGEIVKRRREK